MALIATATAFINEVSRTAKGTYAYKLSVITSSYKDGDDWKDNYLFVTAFSKEDLLGEQEIAKVPFIVELQGLNYSVNESGGQTYVNHSARLNSLEVKKREVIKSATTDKKTTSKAKTAKA